MQFYRMIILVLATFLGGEGEAIFASQPEQSVCVPCAAILQHQSNAVVGRSDALPVASIKTEYICLQDLGHCPDLVATTKQPSRLPVRFHKKYKRRGKAHLKTFEMPTPPCACPVLDSMNLSDVVQAGNFHVQSLLGFPAAFLSSRTRDMFTIMARE